LAWLPRVSVVVAVYNGAETLDQCIQSLRVLEYPGPEPELIVVDNGSRDGTLALLDRHRDRVTVAHERRRGAAAARNTGVRQASGEVVAFTDADCVVDSAWLRHLVQPLRDPRVGIAGGTILSAEPRTTVTLFGERIHDHHKAIQVYRPHYAITMSWASRREVLQRLGGFDESFLRAQDVDLAYRIQQTGLTLSFVPEAIVYHRNERTLRGLFHEGFVHGMYGVLIHKTHQAFVAAHGYRRFRARRYSTLLSQCARAVRGRRTGAEACECVFLLGKRFGALAGSFRFRHVDV
jgi:O-antigen biosynthesis protein